MQITVRFDGLCARGWHWSLLRRLADQPGIEVSIDPRPGPEKLPASMETLFRLEAVLYGLPQAVASAPAALCKFDRFSRTPQTPADLVIDLCGDVSPDVGRVWTLTFDGTAGERALLSLLIAGQTPLVEIVENGAVVAAGRIGTEYGAVASASFEDTLARTCTLIDAAVHGAASIALPVLPSAAEPRPRAKTLPSFNSIAGKQLARAIVRRLYHLCYYGPHWRTGWRKLDGPDLIDLQTLEQTQWKTLPDDGRRFYADPFPISRNGEVTLFVEDYEHKLGKGIISAVTFGPDGPLGKPQPVMEQSVHLSYPFVFEAEGECWMIPESSAAGTVELFRASAFPGGWVKESTLLSGITASDATIIEHGGKWWMFATVRDGGGAFSDALHIWTAQDFRGPWNAHPRNPVLIDIASARPAGRIVSRNGVLVRPVQDCRDGYGAALGLAEIRRLDDEGFEQTIRTILTPTAEWPGRRLHTLNSAGGLEFIDGSAHAPRWLRKAG